LSPCFSVSAVERSPGDRNTARSAVASMVREGTRVASSSSGSRGARATTTASPPVARTRRACPAHWIFLAAFRSRSRTSPQWGQTCVRTLRLLRTRSPHPLQSCDVYAGGTASTRLPAHAAQAGAADYDVRGRSRLRTGHAALPPDVAREARDRVGMVLLDGRFTGDHTGESERSAVGPASGSHLRGSDQGWTVRHLRSRVPETG
jgi:hypothetical protein